MPVVEEIHVGDIGTVLEVELLDGSSALDISGATTMNILLQKPNDTTLTKPAVHSDDGTDGKMRYVTVDGDLDIAGDWKIQGRVTDANGTWRSNVDDFEVHANLDD